MSKRESCLVIGPSWVGDMIMAQGLYKRLKRQTPRLRIDVLAPDWSAPILHRMPEVANVLSSGFAHGEFNLAGRRRLARELGATGYTQAYVLPNSWKSALVPFFAGIPRRTGYVGELRYGLLNDVHHLDKQRVPLLVDRYCALAGKTTRGQEGDEPGCPAPRLKVDREAQQALLERHGLRLDRPVLGLCPGAEFGPSKRWPEEHYAAVAEAKLAAGWQVWLFGSPKDAGVTAAITAILEQQGLAGHVRDLGGKTHLEEVVDLLACSDAVVSNDSGLMHLAAAVDVPLVAVYGSTDPGYTPPYSDKASVVRLGLECSPCLKRECPYGHLDCLHQLGPERVLEMLPQ